MYFVCHYFKLLLLIVTNPELNWSF